MSDTKKFFELLSSDKDVKLELAESTITALTSLLAEKGFNDDAQRVINESLAKIAASHGFKLDSMQELSQSELESVAGGIRILSNPYDMIVWKSNSNGNLFDDEDQYDDAFKQPGNSERMNKYGCKAKTLG